MTIVSSEGSTVTHERRLSSNVIHPKISGQDDLATALTNIKEHPIQSNMPPISFNVNIAETVAKNIYGVRVDEGWLFVDLAFTLQTPMTDIQQVRDAVATIIADDPAKICPQCKHAHGVFQNIQRSNAFGNARRQLKQTSSSSNYEGSVSLLLTSDTKNMTDGAAIPKNFMDAFLAANNGMIAAVSSYKVTTQDGNSQVPVISPVLPPALPPATPPATPPALPPPLHETPAPTTTNDLSPTWIVVIVLAVLFTLGYSMYCCIPIVMWGGDTHVHNSHYHPLPTAPPAPFNYPPPQIPTIPSAPYRGMKVDKFF
jgi:hypothetical protein